MVSISDIYNSRFGNLDSSLITDSFEVSKCIFMLFYVYDCTILSVVKLYDDKLFTFTPRPDAK